MPALLPADVRQAVAAHAAAPLVRAEIEALLAADPNNASVALEPLPAWGVVGIGGGGGGAAGGFSGAAAAAAPPPQPTLLCVRCLCAL